MSVSASRLVAFYNTPCCRLNSFLEITQIARFFQIGSVHRFLQNVVSTLRRCSLGLHENANNFTLPTGPTERMHRRVCHSSHPSRSALPDLGAIVLCG